MRMVAEVVETSGGTFNTVYCGTNSIGFQTVPLSWSTVTGRCLSLQVTEIVLKTWPLKLRLLNWTGTFPGSPGGTLRVQSPAVVQPQEGRTSVTSKVASPTFVKMNVYFTSSPDWVLSKS